MQTTSLIQPIPFGATDVLSHKLVQKKQKTIILFAARLKQRRFLTVSKVAPK